MKKTVVLATVITVMLIATVTETVAEFQTCKTILAKKYDAPSGIYTIISKATGTTIQVYCEMGLNGGGYTFIDPSDLSKLTDADIQAMFTDTGSFLMRVRKTDGTQPYIVLSQLAQYASTPLKLGLNNYISYQQPLNVPILGYPYLYCGFLPIAQATTNSVQGLQANGKPLTFNHCLLGQSPHSQITLFANFPEKQPSSFLSGIDVTRYLFCVNLFASAIDNPSGRTMPAGYFMFTELGWGGCACYWQTNRVKSLGILGTAIGFR